MLAALAAAAVAAAIAKKKKKEREAAEQAEINARIEQAIPTKPIPAPLYSSPTVNPTPLPPPSFTDADIGMVTNSSYVDPEMEAELAAEKAAQSAPTAPTTSARRPKGIIQFGGKMSTKRKRKNSRQAKAYMAYVRSFMNGRSRSRRRI